MRENGKTWYRICKMLCEYKKYFPGIICCLLGSSFITFIHPLLIRQITDCGILQKNMKYILLFSVILIIISLTQQELNIIQTKLFSNVHNQFTHSLYKKTYWKINRMKIQYFAERGSAEIINTTNCDRRRKWKWQINTFEPFGGILPATKRNNKIVWSSCGIDGYTRYEK